jgi:UDP-N-acetylmuramoyl-tripeptide--D-alanyl-D-alanine ligase
VAQAKYELLQALDACGYAVLNLDDPIIRKGRSLTKAQVLGYGLGRGEGLRAEKFELTSKGSRFLLHGRWYWLPLLGEHNLYSALAALTCARIFKVEVMLQRWALARVKPEPGRTQIRKDGVTVIDDSYNANPESVRAALKTLKLFSGRRVVVLGDMLELGPSSDYWHRVLGEEVRRMADLSVFVGKEAKGYGAGYYFETPAQAQVFLRNNLLPGDVVLLKGSRAMEMEKLAEALRL